MSNVLNLQKLKTTGASLAKPKPTSCTSSGSNCCNGKIAAF